MAKSTYDDVPMSLGDHLEELRRRLVWPLIALGALFFIAFAFENRIQQIFVQPLAWAIAVNLDHAKAVGLPVDGSTPKLMIHDIWEAPMASMKVSFYTAFFLAFPVLVYHLWMFVGVGLVSRERRLAFLFVPAGIMFFYAGTMVGYFVGVPYFYSFMIKWAAHNPIAEFNLQLKAYHQNFVMMTMVFGLIADIPWLVMVLVRVGFVTVSQLLKHWKIAIFVNTAIAAVIAPPDAFSMVVMMIPLYLLYFLGVGLSAIMMRRHARIEAREQAAELKRMEEEERAAHEAYAKRQAEDPVHTPVVDPNQQPPAATVIEDPASNEPSPVPRSAITDDLVARDDAPSSEDAPRAEDHAPSLGDEAQASTDAPSSPDAPSADTPRKDDDRV